MTGYLETEAALTECIAACDVALSLRWPTAREISGPWLRALAAGRPTVIMDLEHLAHVPSLDPRTWTLNIGGMESGRFPGPEPAPVPNVRNAATIALDVMDEDHSLRLAMRRLASDAELRAALGAAGRAYWQREHAPERMIEDYRVVLAAAAASPIPHPALPRHLVNDGDELLKALMADLGLVSPVSA